MLKEARQFIIITNNNNNNYNWLSSTFNGQDAGYYVEYKDEEDKTLPLSSVQSRSR